MEVGLIKWFDFEKGFGVIITPSNGEYFLHKSNTKIQLQDLYLFAPIVFEPHFENNKNTASDCRFPKNVNHLNALLQLNGENQCVEIDSSSFNVLDIGLKRIFNNNKINLLGLLTDSFNTITESIIDFDFISYFKLITKYAKDFTPSDGADLLSDLYQFYGDNLNEEMLFAVWKTKNFHYINKTEFDDYEIPSYIFINKINSLELKDFERILEYENGSQICYDLVIEKLKNLTEQPSVSNIKRAYELLPFVKDKIKNKELNDGITEYLYKNVKEKIGLKLSALPLINDKAVLNEYEALKDRIPNKLSEGQKCQLLKKIEEIIKERASEKMAVNLWMLKYIDNVGEDQVIDFMISESNDYEDKLAVFSKIQLGHNILSILQRLFDKQSPILTFELIAEFIKRKNELRYDFKVTSDLNTFKSKGELVGYDLHHKFQKLVTDKINDSAKCDLFYKGWLDDYPSTYVMSNVELLTNEQLIKILQSDRTNSEYSFQLLKKKSGTLLENQIKYFLQLCEKYLSIDKQKEIDHLILSQKSNEQWFELWKSRETSSIRKDFILELFNDSKGVYDELNTWVKDDIASISQVMDWLYEKLKSLNEVKDRSDFYTAFNIVQKLTELDTKSKETILSLNNKFHNLILWHLGFIKDFDFTTLKGKFIYFKPTDQVYIFKRLFYLKHIGQIDFTFNELDEIIRADTDLYLVNEKFKNDFVLDISTHILIEAIKSYQTTNNFLFESDLILKDLKNNSDKKFKIENYFEKCPGRYVSEHNWNTNGEIKRLEKVVNDQKQEFFQIEFEYSSNIVDGVKKITGRSYNSNLKCWRAPISSVKEVLDFAKEYTFFVNLPDGFHYSNNTHLANFKRDSVPTGIKFCEGRKANKKHNKLKCDFWWCKNQECFQFAEIDHLSQEFLENRDQKKEVWESYTLLDILRILNINTDEYKANEEAIIDGHYYKFLGHINAFNRLLDKLYCKGCDELLYPKESSHFGLYRDTKFNCINNTCSKQEEIIYLNTCLYGECSSIIDSRVSKRCDHGLYICENCGTCCSHSMFKRRLDSLKLLGGYIHPELKYNVETQNGHLEKAEYYCYKCKGMMTQEDPKHFTCNNCQVNYDLSKFKWLDKKWINIPLRRKDYPKI